MMFSKLPENSYIDDYFLDKLPERQGIWKIRRPYRVMSRLFDKNKLIGYILYSKPNQHCYIIGRNTFVHAVRDRAVEQLSFTSNGVKEHGSLKLECLPYHQVTSRTVDCSVEAVIRSYRQEHKV